MKRCISLLVVLLGCTACSSYSTLDVTKPALPTTLTHFAFGSCAKEYLPQPIWQTVLDTDPELFLFIGDNIYADSFTTDGITYDSKPVTDPAKFASSYQMLGKKPGFAKLQQTVPMLAVWDDHDFGDNDAGKEYPLREEAQQAFMDFFAYADDDPMRQQEGIYHSRIVGESGRKVQFILLDTRYHRDALIANPETDPTDLRRYHPQTDTSTSMLGAKQWRWLEAQLREPADVRFIVSSVQVVAYEHGWESWGTMPHERQKLFDLITQTQANGVVFLSGDRHLTEIALDSGQTGARVPYPLWDFTASGMTDPIEPVEQINSYGVGEPYRGSHFATIDIDWATPTQDTRIVFRSITEAGEQISEQTVLLSDLQLN